MDKKVLMTILAISSLILILVFLSLISVYRAASPGSIMSKDEIGVLEIKGIIMDSDDVLKKIKDLKDRDSVKAVVVRIDSPGGGISAAQEIYHELKNLDKIKPVIASFSSVAASGGYYVALGARTIFANEGSLTGSIGVIMQLANLERLYQFIKISPITIKSGKFKDIGNAARPMTLEEKALLQRLSDDMHAQFKAAVSMERKLPISIVNSFADGRVFSGLEAQQLKLVDTIGTFNDAVQYAVKLSKANEKAELYYPDEEENSILREIFSSAKTFMNKTALEAENPMPRTM
ncbi:MAG: signal peptide peptidase SppA [Pseudomonadota bacterium]